MSNKKAVKTLPFEIGQEGQQNGTGYVRDDNAWHIPFWIKEVSFAKRLPSSLATISNCRSKISTVQIFSEAVDDAPKCEACSDPEKSPPLCAVCSDPLCLGVHAD